MTKAGIPDILANVNGYFVGIEVKASKGKPSELQIYHRDKIREAGGISIIVYPEQWEDFKNLINDLLDMPCKCSTIWDDQIIFDKE